MTFSRNWLEQSAEAAAEGVCHTDQECRIMYSEIPQEKKDAAIAAFRKGKYAEQSPEIRKAIAAEGEHWNVPYHLGWGMSMRNFFRQEGFGEDYFGVDNLDCIYRLLIEDCVKE